MGEKRTKVTCSICGRDAKEVSKMILGMEQKNICSDCLLGAAEKYLEFLRDSEEGEVGEGIDNYVSELSAREIMSKINKYVVGQESAKETLAIALRNHYARIKYVNGERRVEGENEKLLNELLNEDIIEEIKDMEEDEEESINLDKSNVMLIGPTGSGKTYITRILSTITNLPFVVQNATSLTSAGYVGEDVEGILAKLYHEAKGNIKLAEMGIVYVDEIDKLARTHTAARDRDVGGEGVQQALLKMIEGDTVNVNISMNSKDPRAPVKRMKTDNILWIVGGAFVGLDSIRNRRIKRKFIGYNNPVEEEEQDKSPEIQTRDLVEFGMIPELVGRIPIIVELDELRESDYIRILTEPKNSIVEQFKTLMRVSNGVELEITESALQYIVEKAIKLETGARSLRSITERVLHPYFLDLEKYKGEKLVITREDIEKNREEKEKEKEKEEEEEEEDRENRKTGGQNLLAMQ